MKHPFTAIIERILKQHFSENSEQIFRQSELLKYLNHKTKSANKGSKSRGSFANLYAIYILIEDYLNISGNYADYDGAKFTDLLQRQRQLPFGAKLQNHALNHRMNEEFKKYFPTCEIIPIIRVNERYWINDNLLKIMVASGEINLANVVIEIIEAYIEAKKDAFEQFIIASEKINSIASKNKTEAFTFILELLAPTVDARIFEIVSFAILKYYYSNQTVYFGFKLEELTEENLKLFKTGRTNANDGGIDFVMKPLGRFFQVTETTDVKKYFLDIDKLEKYPVTFVIKSEQTPEKLLETLSKNAYQQYAIKVVVDKYLSCIEEIINIPVLKQRLDAAIDNGYLINIINEIILQSKIEFNYID